MKYLWRRILATNHAGIIVFAVLSVLGIAASFVAQHLGEVLITVTAVILIGIIKFFAFDSRLGNPPGNRFDVCGVKMHLWAEGEARQHHPVIWVGGGHGEGLVMHHLHRALAGETRSILFDRAGAGWSELGPLPITINGEIEQLKLLLEAAGEKGPFVLAGHSFGGLFSANFAQRYPELVAGLVLMDPTPPANVTCAGRLSFASLLRKAPWRAFALQLGLQRLGDPEITDHDSPFYKCVSDWADIINRNSLQPKSVMAEAAAFEGAMDNPFDMVIGAGALGDIPLHLLLANPSAEAEQQMRDQLRTMLDVDAMQEQNFWAAMDESMEHQLQLSSNSTKTLAPPGSSHMFPYEHPEFVLDAVRQMIRTKAPDAAPMDSPAR